MDKFLQLTIRKFENGDYYFDYQLKGGENWNYDNKELICKDRAETKLLELFELAMKDSK
jgi:hypothetical protein